MDMMEWVAGGTAERVLAEMSLNQYRFILSNYFVFSLVLYMISKKDFYNDQNLSIINKFMIRKLNA